MNLGRLLFGLVLLIVGALLLLGELTNLDAGNLISDWWPLAIIALGVFQWLAAPRAWIGPAILIFFGLVLLAASLEIFDTNIGSLIWPLILIGLGAWFLFGRSRGGDRRTGDDSNQINAVGFLSGNDTMSRAQRFEGGSLTALMGAVTLNLTQAQLAPEGAILDVTVVMGGIEIVVPPGWDVHLNGTPIMGAFENKLAAAGPLDADAPRLTVRGLALMGGVEVRPPK